jgi:23S rRNA (cytidine1920-2'-O)/16S rRNA (cytidine1409-2'-O)-methyltransferase
MRLDTWLVQHRFFDSRQRARMAIEAGRVHYKGQPVLKPAFEVQDETAVFVEGDPLRYASRGGLKLERAIQAFQLDFSGKTVLDAGASTGGFTDCALQHGSAKVFAVDVGTGQLADFLRKDPRVICQEKTDIRQLSLEQLGGNPVDAIVSDLSFISLTLVLPAFPPLLKADGFLVLLVKPQFELKQRTSLKGGIVKDARLREQALQRVLDCATALGFRLRGVVETEVEDGLKKNVEFLAWLTY